MAIFQKHRAARAARQARATYASSRAQSLAEQADVERAVLADVERLRVGSCRRVGPCPVCEAAKVG